MEYIRAYYDNKTGYGISRKRLEGILYVSGDVKNKKILDIGCGDGSLGAVLKDKGAIVHGCDISSHAIKQAAEKLDRALVLNIEHEDLVSVGEDYDIVIATEIIEHLFDSDRFLGNIKSVLSDSGVVIITTPNFLMWTNRIKMLFGLFEYTKTGFLDEGHIRFFTYKTLKQALKKAGFVIEKEQHTYHHRIPEWLGRIRPSLFALQFIIRARIEDGFKEQK